VGSAQAEGFLEPRQGRGLAARNRGESPGTTPTPPLRGWVGIGSGTLSHCRLAMGYKSAPVSRVDCTLTQLGSVHRKRRTFNRRPKSTATSVFVAIIYQSGEDGGSSRVAEAVEDLEDNQAEGNIDQNGASDGEGLKRRRRLKQHVLEYGITQVVDKDEHPG